MDDTPAVVLPFVRRASAIGMHALRVRQGMSLLATITVLALAGSLTGYSQANTRAQLQPPPPLLSYAGAWGVRGDAAGQLDQPTCIATDAIGNVYIADAGSHFVDKFDAQGGPLLSFQDKGLKHPQSITVDSGGAIYVMDSGRGSAFIYFPNGDRYRQLRLRTRPNIEDMLSVAVGDDGLIHILDADAGKVFSYTPRFRLVKIWQPAANVPGGKARAKAIRAGADGYLYVADTAGNRILRFTREGRFVAQIDAGADGAGRKLSEEFSVSREHVFAMDANGRTLHVWSLDGRPEADVDLAPELGQAKRSAPALAVTPLKELLVLDAPEARVLRYRINF
jgi:hypothetical protein